LSVILAWPAVQCGEPDETLPADFASAVGVRERQKGVC